LLGRFTRTLFALLARPGEVVSRENKFAQRLVPEGRHVNYDCERHTTVNSATGLGDSPDAPAFVETFRGKLQLCGQSGAGGGRAWITAGIERRLEHGAASVAAQVKARGRGPEIVAGFKNWFVAGVVALIFVGHDVWRCAVMYIHR